MPVIWTKRAKIWSNVAFWHKNLRFFNIHVVHNVLEAALHVASQFCIALGARPCAPLFTVQA
jgi:hypothetical protein